MSVKPIDFQVMIPKASDVAKIQHEMNERSYITQHQISLKSQNDMKQSLKKVNSTEQSYKVSITKQQEKNKKQDSGRRKHDENSHSETDDKAASKNNIEVKGSIIDISV